jgi:GH15 family glucan-1,4-alpha-glucosidase
MPSSLPQGERFPPIEDHGVVGDLATVALVGTGGTVDFLCWPDFDGPTVFAALLDPDRGGHFRVAPALDGARRRQQYLPDTNVLTTRFQTEDAVAEVVDFLPTCTDTCGRALVRQVRAVSGRVEWDAVCAPRFDYGRAHHRATREGGGVLFTPEKSGVKAMRLLASVPLQLDGADARARFTLEAGESAAFVLFQADRADPPHDPVRFANTSFGHTLAFWRAWAAHSTYRGRWREMVMRSALTLKLLCHHRHGSLVAAPTFGLPEALGGPRNWDYRYVWIRDAAFTLYALIRIGYVEEAQAFMRWTGERAAEASGDGQLQIMYGIDGRAHLPEEELSHLSGYLGSRPVRLGNAAHTQLQLDIYGELMDALYLSAKYGEPPSYDVWAGVVRSVNWVCENWRRPDSGIWEVRGPPREFLHSRVMCWVAVDRALRLAQKLSLPAPFATWAQARNDIHHDVFENFWDPGKRAFVQHKGATHLDAAALLMPLVKLVSPTDPRWLSTLDAVGRELAEDALVRRYDLEGGAEDGLPGEEGHFTACSFWYAECLARAGRVDEARLVFEKMLGYANHLGLYAEELGRSGRHLGNFPQAFTHLALISAATYLDRRLDGGHKAPWSA